MNQSIQMILQEIQKAVVGKDDILKKIFMALLARGHILMEDCPGVGKTTTALAFSKALQLEHKRLQLTPDVMPSDVVGFSLYNKATGKMEYQPGAAICNLLLADELNRASSRTQSALLEAMEEGSVTVDGITHEIPKPYTVIATQNPFGSAGTQPLPESQADRFMIRIFMGYPSPEDEFRILKRRGWEDPLESVRKVADATDLIQMQRQVEEVYISNELYSYIVLLADATRRHPLLELGVSPRGSIALTRMSRAAAWIEGRNYVIPTDIQGILHDTWEHRLLISSQARRERKTAREILSGVVQSVPLPRTRRNPRERNR